LFWGGGEGYGLRASACEELLARPYTEFGFRKKCEKKTERRQKLCEA
jgi:hypothetical protein